MAPSAKAGTAVTPAVGVLRAFLNTREMAEGTDQLASSEGLRDWMASMGLVGSEHEVAPGDGEWVRAVREALRDVLAAHNGAEVPLDSLSVLNQAATRTPLVAGFDESGNLAMRAAALGAPGAIGRIWSAVLTSQMEKTWPRLKACRRDDCRWIFLDQSKNHSGTWCTSEGCGALMKARAYRRRQAGGAATGSSASPRARTDCAPDRLSGTGCGRA